MDDIPYLEITEQQRKELGGNVIEVSYDDQVNDVGDNFARFLIKEGYKVTLKSNPDHPSIYYEITKD